GHRLEAARRGGARRALADGRAVQSHARARARGRGRAAAAGNDEAQKRNKSRKKSMPAHHAYLRLVQESRALIHDPVYDSSSPLFRVWAVSSLPCDRDHLTAAWGATPACMMLATMDFARDCAWVALCCALLAPGTAL